MALATRSRAIAAGIDVHEYDAVTAEIEDLDAWSDGFRDAAVGHFTVAVEARAAGRQASAREAFRSASAWYFFAGAWPSPRVSTYQEAAQAHWAALELGDEPVQRIDGPRFRAVLRRPTGAADAPLVVLVPGLDGAKEELASLSDALLARGCATIAMDGPGQGELVGEVAPTADYASVVTEVLDAVAELPSGEWRPRTVGALACSIGGLYATASLAREPRLRAGVIVSGLVQAPPYEHLPPLIQGLLGARTTTEAEARNFVASLDITDLVPSISVPVLVVDGDADPLVNGDFTGAWIAGHVPGAQRWVISGGDHNVANARWKWLPGAADWLSATLREAAPSFELVPTPVQQEGEEA
jgi:2,6-dihydroxypseudooxynicotine hydrolase